MTYRVRFTQEAEADLVRLYEFILDRDAADWALAGLLLLALAPFPSSAMLLGK